MKTVLRRIAGATAWIPWLALIVVRLYQRALGVRGAALIKAYDSARLFPIPDHYYEPLVFPPADLTNRLSQVRDLPGIDLRLDRQLELLAELARFATETESFPLESPDSDVEPYYNNQSFESGDAEILYEMIRHLRPRRVIEIGSGFSTRFAAAAIRRNREEDAGYDCRHVCIEPYRSSALRRLDVEVIAERVEDVDLSLFQSLQSGDLLFIDSSHVVRPQGDVVTEYLQILPSLACGVVVHIHDVFTPRDYPAEWVVEQRKLWNEQYIIEALLTSGDRFRVALALNYLHHEHPAALQSACPILGREADTREPGSLWLQVS